MKLSDFTQSLSPLETATLIVFVVYIIFPFKTPYFLAGIVNTPIGLLVALVLTLYLFFYTNPILGVVFIFVAYELIRRSSLVKIAASDNYMVRSSPSEAERSYEMKQMNPSPSITLEEDVVAKMAPAQVFNHSDTTLGIGFKPVIEKTSGSLYK
jgi:hypothetical protein